LGISSGYLKENGVPQESVLSAILLAVVINGIIKSVGPFVAVLLHVDNITIYYSSGALSLLNASIRAVNCLSWWAVENGFFFSSDKTQCVHFTCVRGLHAHTSLHVSNITLPFVMMVKFLGLIVDTKLSWEPHLRYLLVKCEQSLNVLEVLFGRSWGGDQMAILQLYHTLICSMINYDIFVYDSATKSKLSIMDPVHNTGICLATGAFYTSHLESLHVEL
jgi:hypothetical protein